MDLYLVLSFTPQSTLQQLLVDRSSRRWTAFWPKTKSALNIFQASNDLSTSDIVDGSTADALEGVHPDSAHCSNSSNPVNEFLNV